MAVYTPVSAVDLAGFLARYDVGAALSCKGIAEGVENSNFLIDTDGGPPGRFILTLYEKRVAQRDLPWFLALMTHLADAGLPVPRPIRDRAGLALQTLNDRPACLIEFVSGVSLSDPDAAACHAVGRALAQLHNAVAGFTAERANSLGPASWPELAARCGARLAEIDAALPALIEAGVTACADWPADLPIGTIHADLFPDNVLLRDGRVTGLIDFYFACTDSFAYDFAITHSAWVFGPDGSTFHPDRAAALAAGYHSQRPLSAPEIAALPRLGAGSALRFTLTRAWDWLHTPASAMVTRKDPMAFARRLDWYLSATPARVLGG